MVFIKENTLKKILLFILILLFIFISFKGIAEAEEFAYHYHFPDPQNLPYNWVYPIQPTFTVPNKGCALFIDLDTCMMTVYINGNVYKTYPVCGGKTSTPSPVGTWKVVGKSNWGQGFGGSWIALNVPWGKYGIHGTLMPWAVGKYNCSKGCIRMKNGDALELKKLVSWGTVVHIKQDLATFRVLKNGKFGSDVLSIQKMLYNLGYYSGSLDGKFGNGLESSVKNFQKDNQFKVDGIVGNQTFCQINELYRKMTPQNNTDTSN